MDEALCACRFVQFTAAMLIFGTAAFRVYALSDGDPRAASSILARFDGCFGRVMLIGSLVALISGVALLLCQAAAMAGSAAAMIEFAAVGAVLFDTWFGRVWLLHLLLAAMLVGACLGRHPKWPTLALLSLALLASLGWIGHATIGDGAMRIAHQLNQTGHLLAGGLWLGGLVPLAWVLRHCEIFPARDALQSFSHMGYWAVAVLAITGAINSVFLVGSLGAMLGTPYGRLLALKVLLFLAMVVVASINRFRLVPRISADPGTLRTLGRTVALEQSLGIAVLAIVSILGTWPPALYGH